MGFFSKETAPAAPATMAELISQTMTRIQTSESVLNTRTENALSAFRNAANALEQVNAAKRENVLTVNNLIDFLQTTRQTTEKTIADNDAVRGKILEIIGE